MRRAVLDLLINGKSLEELLNIMGSILGAINLAQLNSKASQFRHLRLTFLGLLIKAKGLTEIVSYKAEFLSRDFTEMQGFNSNIRNLQKMIGKAYSEVSLKRLREGAEIIFKLDSDYSSIFKTIQKPLSEFLLAKVK